MCTSAALKLQNLNAQNDANTLWAMAKTGMQVPDGFEAPCTRAAQRVLDFNAEGHISDLQVL